MAADAETVQGAHQLIQIDPGSRPADSRIAIMNGIGESSESGPSGRDSGRDSDRQSELGLSQLGPPIEH